MSPSGELVIEPLARHHDRHSFRCGVDTLDRYLKQQARQDITRRISRVFIARDTEEETQVLGYYTLSGLSIDLSALPDLIARKLPRHPIPAALLGRLAVDLDAQGRGIGRLLLANAIRRTLSVSDQIAIYAMVVDAIDQRAVAFYQRHGFSPLMDGERRLFLPLKSV